MTFRPSHWLVTKIFVTTGLSRCARDKSKGSSVILAAMAGKAKRGKLTVTLVGAGNLAHTLGPALKAAGYKVDTGAGRAIASSQKRAAALARKVGAKAVRLEDVRPASDIIWLCHTDDALAATALRLARAPGWKGKIVFHSSGALSSDVLNP